MAQSKSPFTETIEFEKVIIEPYGRNAYLIVRNQHGVRADVSLTLKQIKALRKKLKVVEARVKATIARQGECY